MLKQNDIRKSPRRTLKQTAGLLVAGKYFQVDVEQVGEGGLGFATGLVLDMGTNAVLHFFVPNGGLIIVRLEVLYTRDQENIHHYGCRFLNLQLGAKRSIRNFVAAKTEEEAAIEIRLAQAS